MRSAELLALLVAPIAVIAVLRADTSTVTAPMKIARGTAAQTLTVPFTLCAASDTWMRPSADVQSRIWNDNRYKPDGPAAYEWTHDFIWNAPDSASITYHNENVTGLWTDAVRSQCPRRGAEPWTEIWALNHHVTRITLDGLVYTVTTEHQDRGFEIVQFRRPPSLGAAAAVLDFVTDDGRILDEWIETSPSVFVSPSRRR